MAVGKAQRTRALGYKRLALPDNAMNRKSPPATAIASRQKQNF